MFNKIEFLQQLTQAAKDKLVSRQEIIEAFNQGVTDDPGQKLETGISKDTTQTSKTEPKVNKSLLELNKIFSLVGGLIIFLGISIFVGINWFELGDVGQVLATLGSGITAFIIGILLFVGLKEKIYGSSFHLIASFLIPGGIYVLLSKFDTSFDNFPAVTTIIFLFLGVLYILCYTLFRESIFVLFSTVYLTIVLYAAYLWILLAFDQEAFADMNHLVEYYTFGVGALYLLVGHIFRISNIEIIISRLLKAVGALFVLVAGFTLVMNYSFWEILFVGLLVVMLGLSVVLRSAWILVFDVAFLIAYLFYLTGKYFVDTVGWPIGLIVIGFMLIVSSSAAVRINQRFIAKNP